MKRNPPSPATVTLLPKSPRCLQVFHLFQKNCFLSQMAQSFPILKKRELSFNNANSSCIGSSNLYTLHDVSTVGFSSCATSLRLLGELLLRRHEPSVPLIHSKICNQNFITINISKTNPSILNSLAKVMYICLVGSQ